MSEELLTSKLGPVVFKIVLEQQKIADIFHLLKKYFRRLPSNETGQEASIAEVGNAMHDTGLVDACGKSRFSELTTQTKGQITFREFVGFMVSEYTLEQKARESSTSTSKDTQTSESLISEELHGRLAPLAFRIAARSDEMTRIFGLFQEMFSIFDVNKMGVIERSEMEKLVEASLLSAEDLQKLDQEPGTGTEINFNQFLGLWMNKYVDEDLEQESVLKSKLGPIVFKIALSQETIRAAFALLRKIYDSFDSDGEGLVTKKDLTAFGFVSADRLKDWPTATEGSITFLEFGSFYASEFALGAFDSDMNEEKSTDISLELAQKVAPHLIRLSARTEELKRIFGLFKAMFDVFDADNDGKINKKELVKLKEADFLKQSEIDKLKESPLGFSDFMAFWVTHYLEEVSLEEERERGKELTPKEKELFPRLFRLDCQKANVTKIFQLLKEIFNILDEDKTGSVEKAEILKMVKNGFLEGAGLPTLANFKCEKENYFSFGEFLLWIAESQTT